MKVENLNVSNNTISWDFCGSMKSVPVEKFRTARLFEKNELIIALTGEGKFPSKLEGFSVEGAKRFEVNVPEGYVFEYLTEHPSAGITVVCGSYEQSDEWYFAVNPLTGELTRHCHAQ